jgi:preprotein translocase subunit YajC
MNSAGAVAIFLVVLAVLIIVGFMAVWRRDQSRSQSVADAHERLNTDSTSTERPGAAHKEGER